MLFSLANKSAQNRLRFGYDTNPETVLRFATGVIGKVSCTIEEALPCIFPASRFGDEGTVRNNQIFTKLWPGRTRWATVQTTVPDTADVSHHPSVPDVNHLVECAPVGKESRRNVAEAVKTHDICLAAEISAGMGGP